MMSSRSTDNDYYREFRVKNGLAFNRAFVPCNFADLSDLDHKYVLAEEAAAKTDNDELAALKRRVADLGRRLLAMPDAILETVGGFIGGKGFMTYAGTWDSEQAYPKGSVVASDGATRVALARTVAGGKPNKSPERKLTAKGEGR